MAAKVMEVARLEGRSSELIARLSEVEAAEAVCAISAASELRQRDVTIEALRATADHGASQAALGLKYL